jgi:hypothetical protein
MPYADDERIHYLTVAKLQKLLGEESAAAILKRYGGTRVRVPALLTVAFDDMACLIGEEPARALTLEYEGKRIMLPRPPETRAQIALLLSQGRSLLEIARELGKTVRHVQRVIVTLEENRK